MKKIGSSMSFQLVEIFNIIENKNLSIEEKKRRVTEYQKSLTQDGNGIPLSNQNGQNEKNGFFVFRKY